MSDFIPFSRPSLDNEEKEAISKIIDSQWLTTGKETLAFEKEFAEYIHNPYCLAVNSATSGLQLAMDACGITQDTAILTTPYTFASTALPAIHLGGKVHYADIEKDSYNINPEIVETILKQHKEIKAIVPVHIAGNLCNMKALQTIAQKYDVKLIEDAAHAFPSKTQEGFAGTLSDIGVFSFYATKTMTTAEGGMITTKDEELNKRMNTMRLHGIDRTVWNRYTDSKASWVYDVVAPGWKCNLPDILSAMGRIQLAKAYSFYEKRKKIVEQYNEVFKQKDYLICPPDSEGNAWHLYLLRLDLNKLSITRDEFAEKLQEKGIGISMHFIPHFHLSYFKNTFNLNPKDFPEAQSKFMQTITLPLWPDMTESQVERVINEVCLLGEKFYVKN